MLDTKKRDDVIVPGLLLDSIAHLEPQEIGELFSVMIWASSDPERLKKILQNEGDKKRSPWPLLILKQWAILRGII